MRTTSTLALVMLVMLLNGPAAAETTTPIVPNDVGHWLNLEQRTGRLAPEIAENRHLVQTLLVVERSLAKLDSYLTETRQVSGCHQLILPYSRIALEPVTLVNERGDITLSQRKVRYDEKLTVGVCSTVDQRIVYWDEGGALVILARPRNLMGDFPRTLYGLFQISLEERARWSQRSQRLADRGKQAKPPRIETLYLPPGDEPIVHMHDPMITAFGAEFGLPAITAGESASERPGAGQWPPERDPTDR